jgi:uncharacterized membrane protein
MPETEKIPFLSPEDEKKIVDTIKEAEKATSGEIRVHIEEDSTEPPLKRAEEVFAFLNMHETKDRNGVLFYVCVREKKFAVLGDEGINNVVPEDFWESVKDHVIREFKKGNYADGLTLGIIECGMKLNTFFPYKDDDVNELSDEISKT